jgi:VanZ family protein
MNRRWLIATLVWTSVIWTVSSIPNLETPDLGISYADKIAHMAEYAVLGFLLTRLFSGLPFAARLYMIFGLGVICGGLDELHQHWIPGRQPDWFDFLADTAGVIAMTSMEFFRIRLKIG